MPENVFPRGDQEAGRAARRVEQAFVLFRVDQFDHEVDDVARRAELAGVALAAEHGEQVFEGVAEALRVVVGEAVDFLEEGAQRFRVAVGQVGVLEDVAEERGDAGVFVHAADGFGVAVELFLAGEFGRLELAPAVAGEVAGKEAARAAEVFRLAVHVVHELVDERDGDLFDLRFGVRHLADEDVAAGVDAAFCFGVEHGGFRCGWRRCFGYSWRCRMNFRLNCTSEYLLSCA